MISVTGFEAKLELPYDKAIEQVIAPLKTEGF